jgi:hypothetical protein
MGTGGLPGEGIVAPAKLLNESRRDIWGELTGEPIGEPGPLPRALRRRARATRIASCCSHRRSGSDMAQEEGEAGPLPEPACEAPSHLSSSCVPRSVMSVASSEVRSSVECSVVRSKDVRSVGRAVERTKSAEKRAIFVGVDDAAEADAAPCMAHTCGSSTEPSPSVQDGDERSGWSPSEPRTETHALHAR